MQTVSVVIPVFNGAKTLGAAIDSALQQSYPVDEVLVINDGSKDNSAEVARCWAERSAKVRFFDKENGGVSSARNRGINEARSEWIAFLDADDTWIPEKLAKQLSAMQAVPDVSASYTGMWVHDQIDGSVTEEPARIHDSLLERLRYGNCGIGGSSLMIRASVLQELGGFDSVLDGVEDWELILRLLISGKKILTVPEPLIHYTAAMGSLSMSQKIMNQELRLLETGKLLHGLRGPRRLYTRQRILAEVYCRAGFTARTKGNHKEAFRRFYQSVTSWPSVRGIKALIVTGRSSLNAA